MSGVPWILAARPKTLTAAAAPVAVGTGCAVAAGGFAALPAVAALAGAALIQIGTNLVNDAADFARGADGPDRLGPPRAAASGLLPVAAIWRAAALCFALALVIGVYLAWRGGWPIVAIGLVSIAAGAAYTAGPLPLAYLGVADLAVLIFFGPVAVGGTTLVQTGSLPTSALWASVPIGALATAMLAINNLRDRDGDRAAGKKTVAVRFGRRVAIGECLLLYAAAFATPPIAAVAAGSPWLVLPLASAPLALAPLLRVANARRLNAALAETARLLMVFALLWAVGIAIS